MNDLLKKGYAEKVPDKQLYRRDGRLWYIPHHGIYHKRKGKIRVVFDCTSTFRGTSLNSELLQGPDLTNTLLGVLLRFRQDTVAVMADIEGMFHQVKVPEEDKDFLRFLWWPDGNTDYPLSEYRMTVHLFGAVSSPSCANFALKRTADDNEGKAEAEVLSTIRNNFYVDDCLKSVQNEKSAVNLVHGLRTTCATGGFKLTKWVSSSRSVLATIPEEDRTQDIKTLDLEKDKLPMERALGIRWNMESDAFFFSIKPNPHHLISRRNILSIVNSIYDPFGFLAPLTLPAKRIVQELCRRNFGWDEVIPTGLVHQWNNWLSELMKLSDFSIDRCLKPQGFEEPSSVQLHHFCDASEVGYGTASYLRFINKEGHIHTVLVMGKARVAPLKTITIPRLELAAAVLAVRIDRMLRQELELPTQHSFFWTDSTSVLKYIFNDNRRFLTYVANRVSIIRELSQKSQWKYVSTTLNPADDASRGVTAKAFLSGERWLKGPNFLREPEINWMNPNQESYTMMENDPELKKTVVTFTSTVIQNGDPLTSFIEKFSSWDRLKRMTAWILKFKSLLRLLSKRRKEILLSVSRKTGQEQQQQVDYLMSECRKELGSQTLSLEDLEEAEKVLVIYSQQRSFDDEIVSLKAGKFVKRSSKIYKLDPIFRDSILRVGGRLSKLAMPEEIIHPAILPSDCHLSKLLLNHIHSKVGHCGRSQILSTLRKNYWIIKANSAARRIIRECVLCRRWNSSALQQKMGDLPICRITPDLPPFTSVGLDYFGPIEVRRGRNLVKRYGAIFTCLISRAVHLEVVFSLDTNSCISALRRFICRRGQVKEIVSDNGTSFIGAERELKRALTELNTSKIQNSMLDAGVKWTFNPPYGSHHGGAWERLIRLIKKTLYSTIRQQTLDDEGLLTVLCEIESILNNRPITMVSEDVKDPEALTPNHLLLLKGKVYLPPGVFNEKDIYVKRRWRQIQYMADLFWKRWTGEYLPLLQERQKWNVIKKNLKHGDIVLIIDDTAPRNSWPMGRIVNIFPDKKGIVRRVQVKTKSSTVERPITKLCLLMDNL